MRNSTYNPLVSIAIPAYKVNYLSQAIQSALDQTYTNIEVIIVNDKSPYDIASVVNSFRDERVRYYENENNVGKDCPVENWNICLSHANGEYFTLLCDDDIYDKEFIETLIELSEEHPDGSVFRARCRDIDKNNRVIDYYPTSPPHESCIDYIWHHVRDYRRQTVSEFMLKTDTVKKLGGYTPLPKAWYSDNISIFRFAKDYGIISTPRILMSFRMSGENISTHDNKNVSEKLNATHLFSQALIKIIDEIGDADSSQIIKEALIARNYNSSLSLLIAATYRDFYNIFRKRDSGMYDIPNKCFRTSLIFKLLFTLIRRKP